MNYDTFTILIVPHGVLIIDDYGWCRGVRQATDEFFRDQPFKPMLHRVDQGPRLMIKPAKPPTVAYSQ